MGARRFGTFEGVFTPTFLSILGVIMFLRLGWVIGQVGLAGAITIIVIANLITIFTSLSISSVATNMRIGTGGAYAIISRSLGWEAGGAIGIPLYLSQAISVAFYVTGFTECWMSIFPGHIPLMVSLAVWALMLIISYTSAKIAFRLQYGIIVLIFLSIVSFLTGRSNPGGSVMAWQGINQVGFWAVFAIFFPAVTGILSGVSMSGELKKPERSIPVGTITAIVLTFIIYLGLAWRFAYLAHPGELVNNSNIMADISRWRFLIYGGIMGATISSALSMSVAAPRTLLAMGKHGLVPFSSQFGRVNKRSEPTAAILMTAFISLVTILMGTLNSIASLLTIIFLITYGLLNASVYIEKILGISSFRPSLKIPAIFSFLGALGCVLAMVLVSPVFGILAVVITVLLYAFLVKVSMGRKWPDVRKGLFIFLAERTLQIAKHLPYHPKIWKPNLLVPVKDTIDWQIIIQLIEGIACPNGRVSFFTVLPSKARYVNNPDAGIKKAEKQKEALTKLSVSLSEEGLLVSSTAVTGNSFVEGAAIVTETSLQSFFPPNAFFMRLGHGDGKDEEIRQLLRRKTLMDLGVIMFMPAGEHALGERCRINLWMRKGSPNVDLAVLIALQLEKNWDAEICLVQFVSDEKERAGTEEYLAKLKKLMRIPGDVPTYVSVGQFQESIGIAPKADLNIFGVGEDINIARIRMITKAINTSCLFLKDSRHESAFA